VPAHDLWSPAGQRQALERSVGSLGRTLCRWGGACLIDNGGGTEPGAGRGLTYRRHEACFTYTTSGEGGPGTVSAEPNWDRPNGGHPARGRPALQNFARFRKPAASAPRTYLNPVLTQPYGIATGCGCVSSNRFHSIFSSPLCPDGRVRLTR
jgi:hypothetical protein